MMNDETTLMLIPNSMRWLTNVHRYLEEHAFKSIDSNVTVNPTCIATVCTLGHAAATAVRASPSAFSPSPDPPHHDLVEAFLARKNSKHTTTRKYCEIPSMNLR
jgi:hypothetical protein